MMIDRFVRCGNHKRDDAYSQPWEGLSVVMKMRRITVRSLDRMEATELIPQVCILSAGNAILAA